MQQVFSWIFPQGIFSPFMIHAFESGTIVALLGGLVGFFVVLRGATFVAHVLPKIGFAGAAGAILVSGNALLGLAVFSVGGALGIGWLGKGGRHDVVTALTLVVALGTGALFLGLNNNYATGAFALLFGQLVGVSSSQVADTAILAIVCVILLIFLYRPLLFVSVMKEAAAARGVRIRAMDMGFLVVVGLATAITVPVVGALLCFSLLIGPAATARYLAHRPIFVLWYAIMISVFTIWIALLLGYDTGWPIGFFVSAISALAYGTARSVSHTRGRHRKESPKGLAGPVQT
jgi:zinc/manganese transport system permease protein